MLSRFAVALALCECLFGAARTDYITYLGGSGPDLGRGIAVDYAGALYVAGSTSSSDFPLTSTLLGSPSKNHPCAFVTKFNPEGTGIEFSVCLHDSQTTAFALDPSGAVYLAVILSDGSNVIVKLDRDALNFVYSTSLGPSQVSAIAADAYGGVYVTGSTSNLSATTQAYQQQLAPGTCHGGAGVGMSMFPCSDAFAVKLAPSGEVKYATYLGGSGPDSGSAIAVDSFGNAWVTGTTVSPDWPTTIGALQNKFQGEVDLGPIRYGDGFIAELNPAGSALLYSSYLGGSRVDTPRSIAVDARGSAYVAGSTQSPDFPVTPGAFQPHLTSNPDAIPGGAANGFVTELDAGGHLIYSTYIGAASGAGVFSIAVDSQRQAYLYVNGYTGLCDSGNVAVILNADGSAVVNFANIEGQYLAIDGAGGVYSAATTMLYTGITTAGAYQTTYGGGDSDVIAAKIDFSQPAAASLYCAVNAASLLPGSISRGEIITLFGSGFGTQPLVTIGEEMATVLFASDNQINAIVPNHIITAAITVQSAGQALGPLFVGLVDAALGLFTLDGKQVAATNQDGTVNSASNPAARGSAITLYATGFGYLNQTFATIGQTSVQAKVVGSSQVTLTIPLSAPVGPAVPISLTVDGAISQTATLSVN